ncbi:hypothetical protein PR048_007532 [Dryococelus australis]|uniref:Uncharacterized protein n=1 Tax=Dryococelus australis TaxID=614101 RepID=A0ABQ9HUH5_9NEOP|nr:hypothetical protein PR048_007532 [Dryococelus australis]
MKGRGGNGRSPTRLAEQRHRPARFPQRKSGDPTGDRTRFALVGGGWANRSATAAPPTLKNQFQFPAGSLPDLRTRGNSAGRCRWSTGFLGDIPFPRPFIPMLLHIQLASPSSALKTPMRRPAHCGRLHETIFVVPATTRLPAYILTGVLSDTRPPHSHIKGTAPPCVLTYCVFLACNCLKASVRQGEEVKQELMSTGRSLERELRYVIANQSSSATLSTRLCAPTCATHPFRGLSGAAARLFTSHLSELGLIPGGATPGFRPWDSCRTTLIGGFSRGSPVSPALAVLLDTRLISNSSVPKPFVNIGSSLQTCPQWYYISDILKGLNTTFRGKAGIPSYRRGDTANTTQTSTGVFLGRRLLQPVREPASVPLFNDRCKLDVWNTWRCFGGSSRGICRPGKSFGVKSMNPRWQAGIRLDHGVLMVDKGEARRVGNCTGMQEWGKREIPRKSGDQRHRPT